MRKHIRVQQGRQVVNLPLAANANKIEITLGDTLVSIELQKPNEHNMIFGKVTVADKYDDFSQRVRLQ